MEVSMKLNPQTLAAHHARHQREKRYPAHTLAPDPQQPELDLRPNAVCNRCGDVHDGSKASRRCEQAAAQLEQY